MSIDKELGSKSNILTFGTPTGTVEVQPHPEDVIEVAPEILAVMNARLKGETFDHIFDQSDQVTNEFLIRKELEKLKRLFGDASQVYCAFTSLEAIKEIRKEMQLEELNRELLAEYSLKRSGGTYLDEVDVYAGLLSGSEFITKQDRINKFKHESQILPLIQNYYLSSHFELLGIIKETIQLEPKLRASLQSGNLVEDMNRLLQQFYGEIV